MLIAPLSLRLKLAVLIKVCPQSVCLSVVNIFILKKFKNSRFKQIKYEISVNRKFIIPKNDVALHLLNIRSMYEISMFTDIMLLCKFIITI